MPIRRILAVVFTFAIALTAPPRALSQAGTQATQTVAAKAPVDAAPPTRDLLDTRTQFFDLLKMSPTLRDVVTMDPSLLGDGVYVGRVNPELQQFLTEHPQVARNPEFYLFADFPSQDGRYVAPMVRHRQPRNEDMGQRKFEQLLQILVFLVIVAAVLWLLRMILQSRRWTRIFRMQAETHNRIMEKFGNSEELLRYMDTEPGRRFLEAAPIPIEFEQDRRLPAALARVLSPLQIGTVLTLLGAGILGIRHSLTDIEEPLLIFGIVVLMPGIGFILSAVFTWWMSSRLGLMPNAEHSNTALERQ